MSSPPSHFITSPSPILSHSTINTDASLVLNFDSWRVDRTEKLTATLHLNKLRYATNNWDYVGVFRSQEPLKSKNYFCFMYISAASQNRSTSPPSSAPSSGGEDDPEFMDYLFDFSGLFQSPGSFQLRFFPSSSSEPLAVSEIFTVGPQIALQAYSADSRLVVDWAIIEGHIDEAYAWIGLFLSDETNAKNYLEAQYITSPQNEFSRSTGKGKVSFEKPRNFVSQFELRFFPYSTSAYSECAVLSVNIDASLALNIVNESLSLSSSSHRNQPVVLSPAEMLSFECESIGFIFNAWDWISISHVAAPPANYINYVYAQPLIETDEVCVSSSVQASPPSASPPSSAFSFLAPPKAHGKTNAVELKKRSFRAIISVPDMEGVYELRYFLATSNQLVGKSIEFQVRKKN